MEDKDFSVKSENKNFLLNVAYQLLSYVFPLITVSYISRRLGVANVGIYSYTYSIVYMFMLVAMLGINNYGNREIAKVRDNRAKTSNKFWEIYKLQLSIVAITILGYVIYLFFFCKKYENIAIMQGVFLLSVCFDINWFYFGLEKFKLTITRNCIIKVISLILIVCFIRTQNDLVKYTLIMAGSTVLSQLYLMISLPKFIDYKKTSLANSRKHLKSCLILFIPVLAFGIYRVMDKTMIGAFSNVNELGYYENAERLINIPISIINALGTVMLPRMAYLLQNKKMESKSVLHSSMKLALVMATIMAGGLFLISDDIAVVLFGSSFIKSGNIMRILSVTIIASAWANVIRTQYLIPMGFDKVYVISTLGGAIVNLILNLLLIRSFGAYGACVGTIAAEYFVMLYQTYKVKNVLEIKKYFTLLLDCLIKDFGIIIIAYFIGKLFDVIYIRLFVQISVSILLFILLYYKFIIFEFLGKKQMNIKMN